MKKTVFVFALAAATWSTQANAQDLPLPSPSAEVEQTIGLTEVEVEYHRPGAKERNVWGDLVPYGKLWRTGANKNTVIEFSTKASIAGQSVEAGKYSLFLNPNENEAELFLNTETEGWGTGKFQDSNTVLSASVEVQQAKGYTETMLFYFDNVTYGTADLILTWADRKIVIPIEVDYVSESLKNIEKAIKEDRENFRVYNNAASFYVDNNLDPAAAVKYARTSVELEEKFWNVKTLSEALAANEEYKEAVKVAEKSLKMSEEAEYEPYIKANTANIEKWKKMK